MTVARFLETQSRQQQDQFGSRSKANHPIATEELRMPSLPGRIQAQRNRQASFANLKSRTASASVQ